MPADDLAREYATGLVRDALERRARGLARKRGADEVAEALHAMSGGEAARAFADEAWATIEDAARSSGGAPAEAVAQAAARTRASLGAAGQHDSDDDTDCDDPRRMLRRIKEVQQAARRHHV